MKYALTLFICTDVFGEVNVNMKNTTSIINLNRITKQLLVIQFVVLFSSGFAQTGKSIEVPTKELIKIFRTQLVTNNSLAKLYGQVPTDTFLMGTHRYIGYRNSGVYFMSVKVTYFNAFLIDITKTNFVIPPDSLIKSRALSLYNHIKAISQPIRIFLIEDRFTPDKNKRLAMGFDEFELISVPLSRNKKKRIEALKPDRMGNFSKNDFKQILRLSKKIKLNYIFYEFDDNASPESIELN